MDDKIIFITFVGSVLAVLTAFIWVAMRLGPKGRGHNNVSHSRDDIIDEDLRLKLRERGIARFEKTLDQNSTFLQQDLHKIGEEISDIIKDRAIDILKDEFNDQKKSIAAAQQHMSESFRSIDQAISEYQTKMAEEFKKELLAEKERRLQRFQTNMADVVTHHVQQALGTHLKVDQQIEFILKNLEENKTAIVEDIKREF